MKRLLLLLLIMTLSLSINAKDMLSIGGTEVFAYRFDNNYYLLLKYQDDINRMVGGPIIIKFMMTDGSILRLEGFETNSIKVNNPQNNYIPIETYHYLMFKITFEQITMFKNGVERFALSTVPEVYEKHKWVGRKSFGQKLYNEFMELKDEFYEETDDDTDE